jgi:anti-sigma factor RsiW
MNSCAFLARIGAYDDGEAGAQERRRIEAHLAVCPACRAELLSLRALSKRLAAATGPALATEALGALHARLDLQFSRPLLRTARTLLALAACLLVACTLWAWQVRSASAGPAAAWEDLAVNPQPDAAAGANPQVAMATWIVQDLNAGGRDAH